MKVIYDDGASEVIAFAAEELAGYLNRMAEWLSDTASGAGWIVSLKSERGAFPDAVNDSYRVQIGEAGGSIIANNDRSVLLAVYDYLRFLGCRFLMPAAECEIVPDIGPGELTADYKREASYFHRGVCIEGAVSFENVMDYIAWLPKVGFNSFFLQFKSPYAFMKRWYAHMENPYAGEEPYTQENARRDQLLFEGEAKKRGLMIHTAGHGWTGEVLGYQTVSWDTRDAAGLRKFRHRIAMVGGKRELYNGVPANTNLCYHNKDAINAFADNVVSYARENPMVDYLHVWLADEPNNICECPDCCGTTLSDQYVELLNEIDRRLSEEGLDTRIVFLLYQELLWPPVKSRLADPDRFVLMFAPISRTFEKSYELENLGDTEEAEIKLPEFHRNHITLPGNLAENMAFLKAWQKVFPGSGFVYDYPLGKAHYGDLGYVGITKVLHSDIRRLGAMGLDGYISCQELRAAFPNALPDYVMGHTLFDKNRPVEELIDEYFRACYGADAPAVLDYLSGLSALSSCDYVSGRGDRTDAGIAERMERVVSLCEEFAGETARHRDADGAFRSVYWDILEYHRNYVILFARALASLARGEQDQADRQWEEMREYICTNEPEYQPYFDVYRVLEVTQKYTKLHKKS